jgi:serine/threonine-protein phosphatase PP1 catalytic subunit
MTKKAPSSIMAFLSSSEWSLDRVILRILSARDKPLGSSCGLSQFEIQTLCKIVSQIFLEEPTVLDLRAPLTICGDIHGQYHDLLRIFSNCGHPPDTRYLFLGDYVDRGLQSIETICLLFAYKIKYPDRFFLLRGNHECAWISAAYGFYHEILQYYPSSVWTAFCETFNAMPIAAVIDGKIFCVHAGISPLFHSLDDIRTIQRPMEIPRAGLVFDLLWSDPNPAAETFSENERGTSIAYGLKAVADVIAQCGFDLIVRAHQGLPGGYEFPFAPDQRLLTLFSAPNYCYEYKNRGAVLRVDEDLLCRFAVFEPILWKAEIGVVPRQGTRETEGQQPIPVTLFDEV